MATNTNSKNVSIPQYMRPIQPFLDDSKVTEVVVNRPKEIWAKTYEGWQKHDLPEFNESLVKALIGAIVSYNKVTNSSINSVIFPNGERGEICRPPACIDGTYVMAIRKHSSSVYTLDELKQQGTFSDVEDMSFNILDDSEIDTYYNTHKATAKRISQVDCDLLKLKNLDTVEFLRQAVLAKKNIVIAGKTGSGKTTFARSLIENIPYDERIITIEDVHELMLENHNNKVHLLYGSGDGRSTAEQCLKSCMRLSPDRILLAELRGGEAWEYMNSLNTGHPGSITTTHAGGAFETFDRITQLIKSSSIGSTLDRELIKEILFKTLDIAVWMHNRKIKQIFFDPIHKREMYE